MVMKMEHEMPHSGKLPLLAYAPKNFGALAGQGVGEGFSRRSKACRARAAMGRAGTPLLSCSVEAPAFVSSQAVKDTRLKDNVYEQREATSGLFSRLKYWISRYLSRVSRSKKTEQPGTSSKINVANDFRINGKSAHNKIEGNSQQSHLKTSSNGVSAVRGNLDAKPIETINPVSQAYASMRLDPDQEQAIPRATDLAHALAEVRQALRIQEQQILAAQARQSEDHK